MPGEHNVQNALAAVVVARELGVADATIAQGLDQFAGVGRRFTKVGEWNGAAIIDDYAHNPFMIAAALKAARQAYAGPIIAVVQPHRYTRLRDTFEQFAKCLNDADVAIIAPVYAAGEAPIPGYRPRLLCRGAARPRPPPCRHHRRRSGPCGCRAAPHLKPGGAVVLLGAGSITSWAHNFEKNLGLETAGGQGVMMSWVCDALPPVRGTYTPDAPLKELVWFRVGGKAAEVLFRPADADDLATFLYARSSGYAGERDRRRLQSSGARGRDSRGRGAGFPRRSARSGRKVRASVSGAAAPDANVARAAADAGIAGLEFLRGIPGTIGGALRMNAGCYGREIRDILIEATAIDGKGDKITLTASEMGFSYRKAQMPDDLIFVEAVFAGAPRRAHGDPRAHERAGRTARSDPAGPDAYRRLDI